MTRKQIRLIAALAAALLSSGANAAEEHEGPMHHHHHRFAKDVDAFHGVLAPVWHAAPGKERNRNACAKAGRMEILAKDIRSADATPLQASVAGLKKQCRDGAGDIEGALSDVHDAFHRLIEAKTGM